MAYPQMIAPNGFWMKTHFWQEGDMLHAKSFMVVAGEPVVFQLSVNLAMIDQAIRKYHAKIERDLHMSESGQISGCVGCDLATINGLFGNIAKTVKKIGKSKLVKKVASTAKKVVSNKVTKTAYRVTKKVAKPVVKTVKKVSRPVIKTAKKVARPVVKKLVKPGLQGAQQVFQFARPIIKSKAVGAVAAGLAVAFPPVGVPAAAAYASANAALAAIEKGGAIRKAATSILAKAKKTGVKPKLSTNVKKQLTGAVKLEKLAKKQIKKVSIAARSSSDPKKKAEAQKMLGILSVAQKSRSRIKTVPVQTPAQIKAATNRANQKTRAANAATQRARMMATRAQQAPTVANRTQAAVAAKEALDAKVTAIKAQDEVIEPSARAQGLIITESGLIVPGTFNELPLGGIRAKFYQRSGSGLSGNYQQIGGCIGCEDEVGIDRPNDYGGCVGCGDRLETNIPVSGWPLLP